MESRWDAKTLNQKKQGSFYLYFGVGDDPWQGGSITTAMDVPGGQFWRGTIDNMTFPLPNTCPESSDGPGLNPGFGRWFNFFNFSFLSAM